MGQQCMSTTISKQSKLRSQDFEAARNQTGAEMFTIDEDCSKSQVENAKGLRQIKKVNYKKNNHYTKHEHLPGVLVIGSLDYSIKQQEEEAKQNIMDDLKTIVPKKIVEYDTEKLFMSTQPQEKCASMRLSTWRGQIMNRETGYIEWITLKFQVIIPVCLASKANKIAVLGYGEIDLDDNMGGLQNIQNKQQKSNSLQNQKVIYKVYGEYSDDNHTQIRMDVIFDSPLQQQNLTIVGSLCQNQTMIEGKCYTLAEKIVGEGLDIELFKSVTGDIKVL